MQRIKFTPIDEFWKLVPEPKPALKYIPDWYKKIPTRYETGVKQKLQNIDGTVTTNGTVRVCSPFLDAFQSGYIFEAPCDIEFTKVDGFVHYKWAVGGIKPIEHHLNFQFSEEGFNKNSIPMVFKFNFGFEITTPKGYSCLFTHPLNQSHLPFTLFSGVVDTDKYKTHINFPFQLFDFEGDSFILEAGTPLVQIIPFKREDWKSELSKTIKQDNIKALYNLRRKIYDSYKNQYWSKKTYK